MTQRAFPVFSVATGVAATAAERINSLDGIDTTVLGPGGAFGTITDGALAGNTYRLDISSVAVPDGVTVIQPLVGPGRWLVFPPAASDAPYIDTVCRPEHYLSSTNSSNLSPGTNFLGGSYVTERAVQFDRVTFTITNSVAPYTGRILLYQKSDGTVSNNVALVGSLSFSDLPAGVHTVLLDQGVVTLVRGIYWVVWAKASGTLQCATVDVVGISGLNSNVPAGYHPTIFETAIPVGTTPAGFDPLQGGASGTNAVSFDTALVARLKLG